MKLPLCLAAIASSFILAEAAPSDDMENLRTSCENAASVLNASLNSTAAMDTAGLVQNITWQLGASRANLAFMNTTSTTNGTSNTTNSLNSPYFDYVHSIYTFSEAVMRRGRIYHLEMNLPVYNSLKGLAIGVQAYGMQLRAAGMISPHATIRTFTAGSSIVDAESVWANNANFPGRLKRHVRLRR
ncbi:uncharacterized protein LTR77_006148 [Saxophila tyrrhenica]|uniref:Uncharacterized protein n=1 Tax=Saxophila tyrrhenica TaxID=1690608 RepID=A0AAV9P710_9PEZI|nr:hypothetical protein LTR77_006148 [Saxophila tyrrhenica]